MRYLVFLTVFAPSISAAETTAILRCEFLEIPTVTIYYSDEDDFGVGSSGSFYVADHGPSNFSGGDGPGRIESGKLGEYLFRWAPSRSVMDVEDENGNLIISETGKCANLSVEDGKPNLVISAPIKQINEEPISEDKILSLSESGICKVEAFNWTQSDNFLSISGSTTCANGEILYRIFNEDGAFIGASSAYVKGYIFDTVLRTDRKAIQPRLRYIISE